MRFALSAASVLFAGLLSSAAFADEAAPAPAPPVAQAAPTKMPLRVVRVLEETHQALLFNKAKNTHVLVEMGSQVDGYTVGDIDDDSVTLTPIEGGAQVVLAGPDPSLRRHADAKAGTSVKAPKVVTAAAQAPEDPYAAPMDPHATDDAVRAVEAPGSVATGPVTTPIAAGEGGVRTAEAPGSTPTANVRTAEAPSSTPAPHVPVTANSNAAATINAATATPAVRTVAATPEDTSSAAAWGSAPSAPTRTAVSAMAETGVAVTDATVPTPTLIARTDINAALANFGALAGSIRGSFTPAGARLDAISPDSLLAKAGLRNGDLVTSINNQPLRSLDDAANLYARAGSMKAATIQLQRAGKPVTLRLAFQ